MAEESSGRGRKPDKPKAPKSGLTTYSVEIPRCLLGEKHIPAESPEAAVEVYKASAGITRHRLPPVVKVVKPEKAGA